MKGWWVAGDEETELHTMEMHPSTHPPQTVYSINAGSEILTYLQNHQPPDGDGCVEVARGYWGAGRSPIKLKVER